MLQMLHMVEMLQMLAWTRARTMTLTKMKINLSYEMFEMSMFWSSPSVTFGGLTLAFPSVTFGGLTLAFSWGWWLLAGGWAGGWWLVAGG